MRSCFETKTGHKRTPYDVYVNQQGAQQANRPNVESFERKEFPLACDNGNVFELKPKRTIKKTEDGKVDKVWFKEEMDTMKINS